MPQKYKSKPQRQDNPFQQIIHENAAGIDIGAEASYVAVPADRDAQPVRRFGCFTQDLHQLADWLLACQIQTVAMESTGVYWVPLFQVLEQRGFTVCLVNARHVKTVPGRKSDVQDCQWLQKLHTYGLLSASFRPEDEICVLRSYWRHRETLIGKAATCVQQMHKALEQMNIQLHKVISDITGQTGLAIMDAILAGQRDPKQLAALKDPRIRSSHTRIAKALQGDYRAEHLFVLSQALATYRFHQDQILACDQEIETYLSRLSDRTDETKTHLRPKAHTRTKKAGTNAPTFDLRSHLYRISGVDFTQIEGLNVLTVQTILSEVGLDASKFPSSKHFASWLGLSPDNRITGDKVKSRHTKKVNNRAAKAFRIGAQSLAHSSGPLGGFYRRMRGKIGPAQANTAAAHKMARIFYCLWKCPQAYDPTAFENAEQEHKARTFAYLRKKARTLGFDLVPQTTAT